MWSTPTPTGTIGGVGLLEFTQFGGSDWWGEVAGVHTTGGKVMVAHNWGKVVVRGGGGGLGFTQLGEGAY